MLSRRHKAHYTPVEFCAPHCFSSCTAVAGRPLLLEGIEVLPRDRAGDRGSSPRNVQCAIASESS